jgi:hypothetical protein
VLAKAAVPMPVGLPWHSLMALGGMMLGGGFSMLAAHAANVGRV